MDRERVRELSTDAKLVRLVLENRGPLAPSEVAEEAYLTTERAREGLSELAEVEVAEPVCGVCADREEVYALTEADDHPEPSA